MTVKARRHRQVKQLEGRVVKTEAGMNDSIVLYYENDIVDKYIIELSLEDYLDKVYEPQVHLGIQRITPPFAVYCTYSDGRAGRLVCYLFDHELVEFVAGHGGDSDWYRRISNGDRFYFGEAINNMVVMKTKEVL